MSRLYLDATGNYSDPASTDYKYLRADGRWATPDSAYRFLDAAGEWTAPEVWKPPANISGARWDDIEQLSALAAESPQDYSSYLGQTTTLSAYFNTTYCKVTAMIIGIGHDVDPQGKKLGFTFQLRDGMPGENMMNSKITTDGGWQNCPTRLYPPTWIFGSSLQSRLKTMVKKTHITPSFNKLVETQDKIALLSQVEVFGDTDPGTGLTVPRGEGEQYQWYKQHNTATSRVIAPHGYRNGPWWLRSVANSQEFRVVNSDGSLSKYAPDYKFMLCPCFCV